MGKSYFRLLFFVYTLALCVGGVIRIYLKLGHIDHATGFYTGARSLVIAFNVLLAAILLFLLLINRLKRGKHDYPIYYRNRLAGVFALLCGVGMLGYVAATLLKEWNYFLVPSLNRAFVISFVKLVLGALGGLSLLWAGLHEMTGLREPFSMLLLTPAVWQAVVLLSTFNSYQSFLPVSDSLLTVLFMVFSALFFMGHARNISGMGRKDGRNYVISSGLAVSLCGFFLTLPNYLYMALHRVPMPVPSLTLVESLYVLSVSLYALMFVIGFTKSIKYV